MLHTTVAAPKRVSYEADEGLTLKPFSPAQHFEVRQGWKITDILFNPMVSCM